jgi:DNA polymerase-3 subunit gamma/tau
MTTQALYNKWRGQTFADILGQEHVTHTLQNQIKAGRIGHAYLFTGVRGTGKTSTARILAKAVNCIGKTDTPPCNQCSICQSITSGSSLDLIEIDGASNRGIDEIRDLRDKVTFAPNECTYKVYVIDEVHMLTTEAFNALLKTLEEPPSHVIFVLCTTEPHRLPDTVLSRCQRYDFRRGSVSVLVDKLHHICEQEHVLIDQDALEFVARRAAGSFRDAESLLDQLVAYGGETQITLEQVQHILGSVPASLINELLRGLAVRDIPAGLRAINQALDNGAEPRQFLGEILDHLRALLLLRVGSEDAITSLSDEMLAEMREIVAQGCGLGVLVEAIKLFNEAGNSLRNAVRPQLPLEVAFVEAVLRTQGEPAAMPAAPATTAASATTAAAAPDEPASKRAPARRKARVQEQPSEEYAPQPPEKQPTATATGAQESQSPKKLTLQWVQGKWRQFTMKIRSHSRSVHALVNSSEPVSVHGETITLACVNKLVCDQLMDDKRRDLVDQVLSEVLELPCHIQCVVGAPTQQNRSDPFPEEGPMDMFDSMPPPRDPNDTPHSARDTQNTRPARTEAPRKRQDADLRNHPAVQEAEKLGGKVTNIDIYTDQQEDHSG